MKIKLLASGLLLFSQLGWASMNVRCDEFVHEEVKGDNPFSFSLSKKCHIDSKVNVTEIKRLVLEQIKKEGKIRKEVPNIEFHNLPGSTYNYDALEVDTGHGTLTAKYDIYLVGDSQNVVVYYDSKAIDGSGYADNTKKINLTISYENTSNGTAELTLSKDIIVKRPWAARFTPGLFVDKVKEGLEKDINQILAIQKAIVQKS